MINKHVVISFLILSIIYYLFDIIIQTEYLLFYTVISSVVILLFIVTVIAFILLLVLKKKTKSIIVTCLTVIFSVVFGHTLSNYIIVPSLEKINRKRIDVVIDKLDDFYEINNFYPNKLEQLDMIVPGDYTLIIPKPINYEMLSDNRYLLCFARHHDIVSLYDSKHKKWMRQDDYEYGK